VIVTANLATGCDFSLRAYKTQGGANISISLFLFLPADAGCSGELVETAIPLPLGVVSEPGATITLNVVAAS
jgi:hypothetical protein